MILYVVIDTTAERAAVHGLPAYSSIETVYSGRLDGSSSSQSSCPVTLLKLDWESVSDSDLSALAAAVDCIVATGLVLSPTRVVLAPLSECVTCLCH